MYCPKCGIDTLIDTKFCRGCGMDLQPISQILTGQPVKPSPIHTLLSLQTPSVSPRKKARRAGFIAMGGGLLLAAFLGILGGAFLNLDNDLGEFVASLAGLGGLVFTVGIGIMIYSFFLSKVPTVAHDTQPNLIPPAQPYAQMPPADFGHRVSSVTENTTNLLDTEDNRASRRR